MFKNLILFCALSSSALALPQVPCKSELAGKNLVCTVTYDLQSSSLVGQSASNAFMMVNDEEPSLPEDGSCRAGLSMLDKMSGLSFSVSTDDFSVVSISSYNQSGLLSPEISAALTVGAPLEAYYNFNRRPKVDGQGRNVYGLRFSCSIQN